jgi:peptide/nickel transport system permease protein
MIKQGGRRGKGLWVIAWRQYRSDRLAMIGFYIVLFFFFLAFFAPLLASNRPLAARVEGKLHFPAFVSESKLRVRGLTNWDSSTVEFKVMPPVPYSPNESDFSLPGSPPYPPGKEHWLGTDDRGRDVLARMIWGSRVSLSVGFVAVGIATLIGIILGALAGYFGGWTDIIISRLIEVMINIPTFFLILTIIAFLPPSIYWIMLVIGLTGWPGVARFVRAEFFKLREQDFVSAAVALGASHRRVMFRHILPNALAPVMVTAAFGIAGAILAESGLSLLGFGVPPPTPSWGDTLRQGLTYISYAWWLGVFPGMAVFLSVAGYNFIGEGLRDATDPRLFK